MNLTATAIAKNRITLTVVILVMLAGIAAYQELPKAQDPGFIIRTVVITTRFPGASPERVDVNSYFPVGNFGRQNGVCT